MLSKAQWIWLYNGNVQNRNTYVQFRRDFVLRGVPTRAPLYITADQCYVLYVNGTYVTRGPARGYQRSWPYDEVDLRPYLVRGENRICILAYNAGISTYQYLHQSEAGVLCAAKWGRFELVSDGSWFCRLAPGEKQYTGRLSSQQNYQEWVDKRENDNAWITAKRFRKNGWQRPVGRHFGVMPWHGVEPRGIPNFTNFLSPYSSVSASASGACETHWAEEENLYFPVHAEIGRTRWSSMNAPAGTITIPPAGKGKFQAMALDYGGPTFGNLTVDVSGARGGETLDFYFCEGLDEKHAPLLSRLLDGGSMPCLVHRMTLKPGNNGHEFFQMIGHRFVTVLARETTRPLTVRLRHRETIYPLDVRGKLRTSDPVINDIHRICVRTQRVCMLDAYVDTPWREQAQWWGDARVQAQNTFHLANDARLLARGIRSLAGQETPNGLTYGHAPTRTHHCILPDFSLIWIITLWDYYFQTGKTDLFTEQLPRVRRVLDYFRTEGVGGGGLLRYDERYWLFLDWCDLERKGCPALLNLWYVYTLQKLRDLARAAGLRRERREFEQLLARQESLVNRHFWDSRKRLFRDAIDPKGKPSSRYSIHTQTLAILAGLQPKHHSHMIQKRLLPYLRGRKINSALPSSYWATYIYEAMTEAGFGAEVLGHLRERWEEMIPMGGTLETFLRNKIPAVYGEVFIPGNHSMTHAWAAHPIFHLARILGGVTQTKPNWKQIRYRPITEGSEEMELELVIPTPHGDIVSKRTRAADGRIKFSLKCPSAINVIRS
ncbi:MAG: hypothetical protein JXA11_03770 [Phycisphaerae bacterium]|nr:hypothetical protein [Phycisphaerae bacterium]